MASAGALTFASGTAQAQSRAMSTVWMIQPATDIPGERSLDSGESVLKQRLLPKGLFRLDGNAAFVGSPPQFATGTQLIEVSAQGAVVACEAVARKQKLLGMNQYCLVDYDGNGTFDGMFGVENISKGGGMPTFQGDYPKRAKLITPVAYSRLDPAEISSPYFVEIRNAGKAPLFDRQFFEICYGSDTNTECLTGGQYTSASVFPASIAILGARLTVLARDEGQVRVRVDAPMPPQPFGIMSIMTFQFR